VDPGDVETNLSTYLAIPDTQNTFTPDILQTVESLRQLTRLEDLGLYPYFTQGSYNNFVSIMTTDQYDSESRLMRFAASHIKNNPQGPVLSRITQNLVAATYGRVRLIDALEGNLATAVNLVTGRESLIEKNYKITVAKTLPGKAIDFIQTVAGVEFPWSEIPGDYLSNPANPINYRPEAQTTAGQILQDVTGVLGSLIGIQRRPKLSAKPSDLMIDYMGSGQKDVLFDNLRYSKYAPDYSKSARSQQSSKLFNFPNVIGDAINDVLGIGAPTQGAYIGDDRGEDVKYAMGDFNDNLVRSSYYMSLMFDSAQTELFQKQRNISEGGQIGGKLTWYSTQSKNKLGANNQEYNSERSQLEESLSNRYNFRSDSIMGKTQELLESMPSDGGASRTHVANAIDQTSRIFKEGDVMLSRGSAIKYVDQYGGETGVEYCRVWTKDRGYMNMSDTMKRTGNIRKYDDSVMSTPWNLNIAPMSNGEGSFEGSTNIFKGGDGYYAKKYMFSIENLAWKTSNTPGFTYSDLPYCERGNNGGRVMWFPPYDLKVSEQNNARWDENNFIGRPEPIYTYQNTSRSGQISFKVVVDHPSVLNLLVQKAFKNMSDEEADNYINAFFAGCEEIDFYSLIRTYTTLTREDIDRIKDYLEGGTDPEVIKKYKIRTETEIIDKPDPSPINQEPITETVTLYFRNDYPKVNPKVQSEHLYEDLYNTYIDTSGSTTNPSDGTYMKDLSDGLNILFSGTETAAKKNDKQVIYGRTDVTGTQEDKDMVMERAKKGFEKLKQNFEGYKNHIEELKTKIEAGEIKQLEVNVVSSTSSVADDDYNVKLSLRRTHSILLDVVTKISKSGRNDIGWSTTVPSDGTTSVARDNKITFKELGYEGIEGELIIKTDSIGENNKIDANTLGGGEVNVDCHGGELLSSKAIKRTAPATFYCRQSTVMFKHTPVDKQPEKPKPDTKYFLDPDGTYQPPTVKKPPIDEMKRIIMKTLSECYYFKVLEEESPVQFSSLKEKLRYFQPAFHSTTPEGLNSRLTFLLQCVRPGDTIPIKGVSSDLDIRARNTSFGPPPICVIRVGDFYHSKVVIRDVNITYDEGVWDLNPEGIGVQPMIANVTLQVNFIGGQGLSKPVERLQNALSSNFFANTEMYDPRSINTSTIDGKTAEEFTKEFLEQLQKTGTTEPSEPEGEVAGNTISESYIGDFADDEKTQLTYDKIIDSVFENTKNYFRTLQSTYGTTLKKYGPQVHSLIFDPQYRTVTTYTVEGPSGGSSDLLFFGEFSKVNSFDKFVFDLKAKLVASILSEDVSTMMRFDRFMSTDIIDRSNKILRPKLQELVENKLDELISDSSIKEVSSKRNLLTLELDKLNYLTKYFADGKVKDGSGTDATLEGFTSETLYDHYDECIKYINKNSDNFTKKLDTSLNFNSLSVDLTVLSDILSVLLYENKQAIKDIYLEDKTLFNETIKKKIDDKVDSFFEETKEKEIRISKDPVRKTDKMDPFTILSTADITDQSQLDELSKVQSSKVELGTTLNFYKP
jgi:outer membrane protein OmpA-like peptidoglycan-associated protein